jgi:hypothetical protein
MQIRILLLIKVMGICNYGTGLKPQPGHVQRFCVILEVRLSLQRSQLFGLCVQLFLS